MASKNPSPRLVFVEAEKVATAFQLAPGDAPPFLRDCVLEGVLGKPEVRRVIAELRDLGVDEYIRRTVAPSENPKRKNAPEVVRQLGGKIIQEFNEGPLYFAEVSLPNQGKMRRVVVLAQNRKNKNGVWMPTHHRRAAELVRHYSSFGMPLITFIDTPGADAGEEANRQNQAHAISELIMEMGNLQLPSIGVVFGNGYSGGAIPLAATNLLLSVRDGVFNTIHPMGLSEIAYNYNLSWQECAKYIGVSAYELAAQRYIDGVIDYSPLDSDNPKNLLLAINSAIDLVETNLGTFLTDRNNHFFFDHYKTSILHYLHPSELLVEENRIAEKTPTGMLNVFGSVSRFQRYLRQRTRMGSQSVYRLSRLDSATAPEGDLHDRMEREREERFRNWLRRTLEIRYDEPLSKRYKRFQETEKARGLERGRFTSFFIGTPETNFREAVGELVTEIGLHLYNFWKADSRENLIRLLGHLEKRPQTETKPLETANLLDVLTLGAVREAFPGEVRNLVLFDLLFEKLIENLPLIATELRDTNEITRESMQELLDKVFNEATGSFKDIFTDEDEARRSEAFFTWLQAFISRRDVAEVMKQVTQWKRLAHPRLSEPLFGILSYYFSNLLPSYYSAERGEKKFDGRISPRNIGIKDFWNRLNQAYADLLIQNLLTEYKQSTPLSPKKVIDTFFSGFEELNADLITSNPVRFPGFHNSIERALDSGIPAVGVVTGFADFSHEEVANKVGLVVSNTRFQAGAFDMAACDKVCRLMVECAVNKLPLVMMISSGGMQTKEGAGALFSMAVLNDRITRLVKDFDLPVIVFGFRDCTGGAQASFVTHRLVKTFYLSGAVMPFAGQRVVPSHLPAQAILANYLSKVEGSMDGLVVNPFDEGLDEKLRDADPNIPISTETIPQAIARVLKGEYQPRGIQSPEEALPKGFITYRPVERLLIHARGTTAARLVEGAHAAGVKVVLVQSDADMESYPTRLLAKEDRLVCLGGNTPQDSYLNGMSVIRIAEQEEADAIHPGIGFLSESPDFAVLTRKGGFNFIGPRAISMELMGNKSNAIATARRLKVNVVPGSQGVVTDPDYAAAVAEEIGYPVLIKAAFGGGGKGMRVVRAPEQFREAFTRTTQEALSAFGNGDVYLEKFVESMRHVEVQVLRDRFGTCLILGLRDCTVQRNNQKLIEESGSFKLSKPQIEKLFEHARRIANEVDYIGAGTVEFIYDRAADAFYFMEMNTRLQVEHPVTELVSGVDIVVQQILVAAGQSIAELDPKNRGYAMEVRINADKMALEPDGSVAFVPSPGKITRLELPENKKIRVVQAVQEGDSLPPYYDSLILQLIAHGRTRADTIKALREYLAEVKVEGVYTNLALIEAILKDPVFNKGDYDTGFIEDFFARTDRRRLLARMEKRNSAAGGVIDMEAIKIEGSDELKVLAPRTGIFYTSPTPDDPPFVEIGQEFDVNQTLGLMEAMKVFENLTLADFNLPDDAEPFSSRHTFTVTRVIAESGQTVNQGDLLLVVKPVAEIAGAPPPKPAQDKQAAG